jgi:ATP-dependent exoDNAse (exonuclease V) beta subunit
MRGPAPDQAHRDRVVTDLGSTLFVEAGAGSGKTTALVDRVVELVRTGTVELRAVAAITFTEKAGAELRDRLRQRLEALVDDQSVTAVERERCREAVDQLDGSAIGTLHAFAQRILAENPIEAGLPPRIEVTDEVSSDLAFQRRWEGFRDELLELPELGRSLLLLFAGGVGIEALRALAVAFDQNWDLVADRVARSAPEPGPLPALVAPLIDRIDEVCRYRADCTDPADTLCVRLDQFAQYGRTLREAPDEMTLLAALQGECEPARPSFAAGTCGRKGNWTLDKQDVIAAIRALEVAVGEVVDAFTEQLVRRVAAEVARFTVEAAEERRRSGQLSFHDLLVLARLLLTDPLQGPASRARLHARYQRLLLDEFQDTDPIQVELAVRIAAQDPSSPEAGERPWPEVTVAPGRLFFVGDPKQSIYRFRRADISVFFGARDRFGAGDTVELSANFRTVTPVIDAVNQIFARLMGEDPATDIPVPSQPDYVALQPVRPAPPVGPAVALLCRDALTDSSGSTSAGALRAAEADEVAATVVRAVTEQWSVGTGDDENPWRPATLGDITILVPARTSLPFLEDALEERGIPYRSESSSLVYASRAVRDLLMTLRAADDPTDHLAVVSALRTPLFGCGDDDLFRFKVVQRGRWNLLAPQPDTVGPGPVLDGLRYLRVIHDDRHWQTPAELLARIAVDRRLFELGFGGGRPRDLWRRVRYVIDQARSWGEVTGGGTRQYLQWVARQSAEGARVAEAVLPETDDDAVRIMTIHASKGLEFPITIVSGQSTVPNGRRSSAEVVFPPGGDVGYRFGSKVKTQEFSDWEPIDEQLGFDERVRLLYVACTRARDHLVVSVVRRERAKPPKATARTNAELVVDGAGDLFDRLPDGVSGAHGSVVLRPPTVPEPPIDFHTWSAELQAALAAAARPSTVAATALTPEGDRDQGAGGLAAVGTSDPDPEPEPEPEPEREPAAAGLHKRARDLDLPPWLKGRYGTSVGRAVHGVLQTIDLQTGAGLDGAVAAQCQAEAVVDRAPVVAGLVRQALDAPVIRQAAAAPHWREVYACAPVGDRLLEGYLDLLFRGPSGLVVVDYKTAATSDPALLAGRVDGYRLQGAAYAHLAGVTTGEDVPRVVFLFLTPDGAVEVELPDLDDAVAEVRALVASGGEVLVG